MWHAPGFAVPGTVARRMNAGGANVPRTVVLVGLMGAGKTSIGRRLATRLGVPFIDADAEI